MLNKVFFILSNFLYGEYYIYVLHKNTVQKSCQFCFFICNNVGYYAEGESDKELEVSDYQFVVCLCIILKFYVLLHS